MVWVWVVSDMSLQPQVDTIQGQPEAVNECLFNDRRMIPRRKVLVGRVSGLLSRTLFQGIPSIAMTLGMAGMRVMQTMFHSIHTPMHPHRF